MAHRIAVIPGDGIGKEVVPEGVRVLEAAGRRFGFEFEWTTFDWSCERYAKTGDARHEAAVLALLIDEAKDVALRTELGERLATVYESKFGSHSSALDVMLRAVREAPSELRLWERAESLAVSAGRPTDLADAYREVLRGKVEEEVEVELSERASRLHEDRLGDPMGATPYLERVLAQVTDHAPWGGDQSPVAIEEIAEEIRLRVRVPLRMDVARTRQDLGDEAGRRRGREIVDGDRHLGRREVAANVLGFQPEHVRSTLAESLGEPSGKGIEHDGNGGALNQ